MALFQLVLAIVIASLGLTLIIYNLICNENATLAWWLAGAGIAALLAGLVYVAAKDMHDPQN